MPAISWFGKFNRYIMIYTSKNTYVKLLFLWYFYKNPQCGNKEQGIYRGNKVGEK
jgi:hypothetical protein